jgi:DNA-binding CsgD family transcriptional regulator
MKTKSFSGACAGGARAISASLRGSGEGESDYRAKPDPGRSLPLPDWSRKIPGSAPARGAASRTIDLSASRRDATVCGNGSDVIIVVVLAENSCECAGFDAGFDQDALQDGRSRRITVDGRSMTPTIIQTVRVGGSDVIGAQGGELLASVARALERHEQSKRAARREDDVATPFASLTSRQREIMDRVLAGHPNKIIAADLGISQRTVENHRASIMKKTGAKSLPALVRLAMVAERAGRASRTSQH